MEIKLGRTLKSECFHIRATVNAQRKSVVRCALYDFGFLAQKIAHSFDRFCHAGHRLRNRSSLSKVPRKNRRVSLSIPDFESFDLARTKLFQDFLCHFNPPNVDKFL